MYILKSAQINKFRDQRDIKLDFDRNVNFIIGINGSGKTTVINILKDAISLNNSIRQMPAQSVEIEFQYTGKKTRCSIIYCGTY